MWTERMSENELEQIHAMMTLCAAIFGPNNLIGTDFADVQASRIDLEFV
jgi:hypothetical protein